MPAPITIEPAGTWSDDEWFADQDGRDIRPNDGHWILAEGECEGPLIGGNLCTLNLLPGTAFMPDLRGAIVNIEQGLKAESRAGVQRGSERLAGLISGQLAIPEVEVKVLARRPSADWGELHGLYEAEEGRRPLIRVWMRTNVRRQPVALRTFVRTLLHELCHHLDFWLYELEESFHTEGFFRREAALARQLSGLQAREAARSRIDLAVVSVLLDAGAGPDWTFTDPSGPTLARSEGPPTAAAARRDPRRQNGTQAFGGVHTAAEDTLGKLHRRRAHQSELRRLVPARAVARLSDRPRVRPRVRREAVRRRHGGTRRPVDTQSTGAHRVGAL